MIPIELTVCGGLIGEGTITNCYAIGAATSQLYPKQHEQGTRSERHNPQDDISQKTAKDRLAKKDDSF